jgi:hypothetical protein
MTKKRYKFMYEDGKKLKSKHGDERFDIGKWYHLDKERDVKLCSYGFHCSKQINQAFSYIPGDVLAVVEVNGDHDDSDDKECYRSMKIIKAYKWTELDSVALAVFAAEQVIGIFEKEYRDDDRPRKAIEAAKRYLENPTDRNAVDAAHAAADAADAVDAADAAARAVARAAHAAYAADAAYAAADAVDAADAAYAAVDAVDAADAAYAADAAHAALVKIIEKWMVERVGSLEEIT